VLIPALSPWYSLVSTAQGLEALSGQPVYNHLAKVSSFGTGVNIHCGPDYPDNPPTIQFVSRVNIPCVDPSSGKPWYSLVSTAQGLEALSGQPVYNHLAKVSSFGTDKVSTKKDTGPVIVGVDTFQVHGLAPA
jgi:hypothetical protein